MTSCLRKLVRVCLAVISLTAFSHRILKHRTIATKYFTWKYQTMLHFLCRCSFLFTFLLSSQSYWHIRLKSTAYFFDPPCISWIRLLKSLLQEPNSTPPAGCPSTLHVHRVRTSAPRLSLGFVHSTRTALKLTCNKSTQLHNAFIGHARQRHDLIGCSETNSQFTPPVTRHDKTVLSVSGGVNWVSRPSGKVSRSPSSRGV